MPAKLLFIIDCYKNPYAGTEGQLMKLMSGFAKSGFAPSLLILRSSDFDESNVFPVPAEILDIGSISSLSSWIKLYRYFWDKKREGYGIAHTFFVDASLICPPILKLLGYRVIVSRRDMGYWYTKPGLALLRINAHYVDRVIANSKAVRKITIRKEGYRPDKVCVIYNGYQEGAERRGQAINAVTAPSEHLKIVLVANIRPIKRISDAVHSVAMLRNDRPEIGLYIVGDGDSAPLKALARKEGVGESVHFLGSRSDILDLLQDFDIGILCSESEGFSNTIIEYQQCGLPVVCSRVGGNPEIIEHGVNGYLYEAGDISALAECIDKLASDALLRASIGHAGRDKVLNSYSLDKYLEGHRKLYKELGAG